MARATHDDAEVLTIRGDDRTLLRLVRSEVTTEEDWRSNFDRREHPRKAEIASALEHMGLSMWDRPEPLKALSGRWPQLGGFLAEVRISGELGVWFAETGPEGHYTVWGRLSDLQRSVALPHRPV